MLMLFLFEECNDLLDYGNWWMNGLCCLFDLLCCEVNVIVLIDDKVLMMISCEVGVYNIIDLVWIVLCKKLLVLCLVWLCLLFNNGQEMNELELMNVIFDEKLCELVILVKGCGLSDCGIQVCWCFDGQCFCLVCYVVEFICDNWYGPDVWPMLWIIC